VIQPRPASPLDLRQQRLDHPLHGHPVRHGAPPASFAVYRTRPINRVRVQQECFGQGGLAGIRVRNNGKGAPFVGLGEDVEVRDGGGGLMRDGVPV
jgi:hypothetical protein